MRIWGFFLAPKDMDTFELVLLKNPTLNMAYYFLQYKL